MLAQQDADLVFLRGDLNLQVWNSGAGGVHQGLDLGHGLARHHALPESQGHQPAGTLERGQGGAGDLELAVQGAEFEIGPGHVGHDGGQHGFLTPFGSKELRLGGLRQVPQTPEKIDLPEEIEIEPGQVGGRIDAPRDGGLDGVPACALSLVQAGGVHLGHQEGTAHPGRGPRFGHPVQGQARVVVISQRGVDQFLENRVIVNFPPG